MRCIPSLVQWRSLQAIFFKFTKGTAQSAQRSQPHLFNDIHSNIRNILSKTAWLLNTELIVVLKHWQITNICHVTSQKSKGFNTSHKSEASCYMQNFLSAPLSLVNDSYSRACCIWNLCLVWFNTCHINDTSLVSGSAAFRRSLNAEQSLRAASSNLSPELSSSIKAAIIRTPRVISGKLVVIVVMAAPTAVWSTSSAEPATQSTIYASLFATACRYGLLDMPGLCPPRERSIFWGWLTHRADTYIPQLIITLLTGLHVLLHYKYLVLVSSRKYGYNKSNKEYDF